jgi:drug/metabolite transporter (DMT)-like permease
MLLVATACLFWGLDNQLTSLIASISPAQTTFWKGLVAGLLNLTLAAVLGVKTVWWGAVGPAILVGTLSYGVSIALYIGAARELGATRAQLLFAAAPFFGLLFSVVALGEHLTSRHGVAAILFGGSIALLFLDRHVHAHTHQTLGHAHVHRHDDGHHLHTHPELPPSLRHTHAHEHEEVTHSHPHRPDLHHRHGHDDAGEDG